MPDEQTTRSESVLQGDDTISVIREYFAARYALEIAPTHNATAFDKAMERYNAALASLRSISEAEA